MRVELGEKSSRLAIAVYNVETKMDEGWRPFSGKQYVAEGLGPNNQTMGGDGVERQAINQAVEVNVHSDRALSKCTSCTSCTRCTECRRRLGAA